MDGFLDKMGELTNFLNNMSELMDKVDQEGELVELYVYDLTKKSHASSRKSSCSSGGVAGFSILWHTGVVVFGKEYTFNCNKGIDVTPVNRDEDMPDKTHVLGRTRKTENELKKFLEDSKNTFKAENYELLQLNCQEFCIRLCEFLGVEGLPKYVTKIRELARDIFGTRDNLERTGEVALGVLGVAAIAGLGYVGYKGLTKNDDNKN